MNELNVLIENTPGKLENYHKKYKFVTNKRKMFVSSQFCPFYEIKTRLSICGFYLLAFQKTSSMRLQISYSREKDEKITYRQHATTLFSIVRLLPFSVINTFKEIMMECTF